MEVDKTDTADTAGENEPDTAAPAPPEEEAEVDDIETNESIEIGEEEPKKSVMCDDSVVEEAVIEDEEHYDEEDPQGRFDKEDLNDRMKRYCCVHGIEKHSIPLVLVLISWAMTFAGSWSCNYFEGAFTRFHGMNYGIWTLEDWKGNCQLWNVIYFSYSLGHMLSTARALSMTAMVLGLALLSAMSQALKCHLISWGVGLALLALFITSLATVQKFNFWTLFFLFLYIILVLIVRSLFIHPVHRAISRRGKNVIAGLLLFCFLCEILTLLALGSDFCRCDTLTNERLEGRLDPEAETELCITECNLGPAGIVSIIGAGFWLLSAIAVYKIGVQPKDFKTEVSADFGDYANRSIATKIVKAVGGIEDLSKKGGQAYKARFKKSGDDGDDDAVEELVVAAAVAATVGNVEDGDKVQGIADTDEILENAKDSEEANETNQEVNTSGTSKSSVSKSALSKKSYIAAEDLGRQRTFVQKACCDFRVTERNDWEKAGFIFFRVCLVVLVGIFIFIIVVLCGSMYEDRNAERAPSTKGSFVTNVTCAFNESDKSAPFVTYNTPEEALADNMTVAHCGPCGACSNMWDIETFVRTRKTITIQTKKCGKTAVLGSYEELDDCMAEQIDFTDDCRKCWVDNVVCDSKLCIFTCMHTMFTGFMAHNNVPQSGDAGRLNWCLQCDEQRCGTDFVQCSGSTRRRLGIQSAIERDPEEVCPHVNIDWNAYSFPPKPEGVGPTTPSGAPDYFGLFLVLVALILGTMHVFY